MLCENCNCNEATVRYTHTVNGKTTKYALCNKCYSALSGTENLFSGWLFPYSVSDIKKQTDTKKCDLCGYTVDRIAAEKRVGCARCYKNFEKELAPLISRIHGNKIYIPNKEETKESSEIENLQMQLEKAILEEKYEEAAILRDKIKSLKEGVQ